ncbi:hypothetical protein [Actinomadura bangladeshensis]|jgi:hypothetical protein|nr:hypothetical protein [Actinomadura bangladeshensis]
MINSLHKMGIRSNFMYTAGIISVGLAFASWAASRQLEDAGLERADRWGIFVGEWAPTFFAMGIALRMEETRDQAVLEASGRQTSVDERVSASQSAAMR